MNLKLNTPRRSFLFAGFLFLGFLSVTLPSAAPAQEQGIWRTFLYGNEVAGLTARGEEIWSATSGAQWASTTPRTASMPPSR